VSSEDRITVDQADSEEEELIAYLLASRQAEKHGSFSIRPRAGGGNAPLSYGQQRMWFLDQLEPGNPAYHLSMRQWFSGDLDRDALDAALNEIVDRHAILRTTFGF